MIDASIRLLQEMPLFGAMSEEGLQALVKTARRVSMPAGQCFFHEGDTAQSMFVLERGRVEVRKHWHDSEIPLRVLGRGDCFGEMALIDFAPRSASVYAIESCVALEITADALLRLHDTHLEQFAIIQMNIAREISRRLRHLEQKLFEHEANQVKLA